MRIWDCKEQDNDGRHAMKISLCIISLLWISLGTLWILYTGATKEVFRRLCSGGTVRRLAIFPLLIGLVLIMGALHYKDLFWVVLILGILALFKGLYLLIAPLRHIESLTGWWFDRAGDDTIRFFGLIAFLLGSALLCYLL